MGRRPRKGSARPCPLTGLELELMQVIWQRGDATAAEVGEALKGKHPLAPTTVHTVLANLKKKGYLRLVPTVERALRYAARVPREREGARRLRHLIRVFFNGSPQRLMVHLVEAGDLDEAELEQIRRLIHSGDETGEDEE